MIDGVLDDGGMAVDGAEQVHTPGPRSLRKPNTATRARTASRAGGGMAARGIRSGGPPPSGVRFGQHGAAM
jgi:hypothetical protein